MTTVLAMLCVQCLLGGFDNLWHHEVQARLPQQPAARGELALHAARELAYGVIFLGIAWYRWQGACAMLLVAILAAEIVITIWDFLVEDRTRRLPPLERVLHTLMALSYGAILAVWAPELWRWLLAPDGWATTSYGALSWAMTFFGIGVGLWGLRDLFAVARLGVPQWQRRPLRAGTNPAPRTVLVAGGTGFVGSALVRSLVGKGEHVIVLSRDAARARDRFGPLVEVVGSLDEIDAQRHIDAVVHLAGEALAGGPWTAARKHRFLESRRQISGSLLALIGRLRHKPSVLVCASSVGYYGDRGNELLDENSGGAQDFIARLTRDCELAVVPAQSMGVRLCSLRIGYVLGIEGGMLRPMLPAVRAGGGAVFGDGAQWFSWIHLRDLVRLIEHTIEHADLAGPVNAVAPAPVTQRAFAQALARSLRRPVLWRLPAQLLRGALGDMAGLLLGGQNVVPARALATGFVFEHPELGAALRDLLRRPPAAARSVYVNYDCPVCTAEMGHYRALAQRCGGSNIDYVAVGQAGVGVAAYGLDEADLRRRLFAALPDGELRSGVDAIVALWRELPRYRHLAPLLAAPGIYQLASMLYDLVIAPGVWRWSEARLRRAGTRSHATASRP